MGKLDDDSTNLSGVVAFCGMLCQLETVIGIMLRSQYPQG